MKYSIKLSVISLFLLLFGLVSCDNSDNDNDENFVSGYAKTTIFGTVFDEYHHPKSDVEVHAHGYTTVTGENGTFLFQDIYAPKDKSYVVVKENGYFGNMRSRKTEINGITQIDVNLINLSEGEVNSFTTGMDYTAVLNDGSQIVFPSSTAFVDENNNIYNGTVVLKTKVLDASLPSYSRYAFGGDQIGLDGDQEQYLNTYTGIIIEISQPNGAYLQLAPNTTPVEITQEIPNAFLTKMSAPQNISVYHASLTSGYNKRGGGGKRKGSGYVHSVGHFSYWSTQNASPSYGELKCRVIDQSGNTMSGVRVQVGQTYGITNDLGTFDTHVAVGEGMEISILPQDFFGVSVSSSQPAWNSGEERLVELQLPVTLSRIQGQLVDCHEHPISGEVTLVWEENQSVTYASSGNFDIPTTAYAGEFCSLKIKTAEKDTVISIEMEAGGVNLGNIKICNEYIPKPHTNNYVLVKNNGEVIAEYKNFNTATGQVTKEQYQGDETYYSTHIEVSGNDISFSLDIQNCNSVGEYEGGYGMLGENNIVDLVINVTQFGNVGGKISGTATGIINTPGYDEFSNVKIDFEVVRQEDKIYE